MGSCSPCYFAQAAGTESFIQCYGSVRNGICVVDLRVATESVVLQIAMGFHRPGRWACAAKSLFVSAL